MENQTSGWTAYTEKIMKVCDTYVDPERKIFPEFPLHYRYCPWCGKRQEEVK